MTSDPVIQLGLKKLSLHTVPYFIADIAANHDGELQRAIDLIWRAKEAGADCAKFQHFTAEGLINKFGFKDGIGKVSHQADWQSEVHEIYDQYHTRRDWTLQLVDACKAADIDFMTTPYDLEAIEQFAPLVPAFKVGSGDITFEAGLQAMAKSAKPVLLATGAATMAEVERAVATIEATGNQNICVMQCNTNYTGTRENFAYLNLRVIETFRERWPHYLAGFSDHSSGHAAVLGAIAFGARVIEKHFTDDNARIGPDHHFAMNPQSWAEMVERSHELFLALGDGVKRIEANEEETVVIQRRALCLSRDLPKDHIIQAEDLKFLRPCPVGALTPFESTRVIGKMTKTPMKEGDILSAGSLC